jgi:flagellar hook-associated protein 3 FlgL
MPFRITNSMMVANYNRNQNAAQIRMHDLQNQLATQKKIARLSDDPVNIVKALNARSRLYDVEQYKKNIQDARAWLTQTESAMFELNELIKRGYELAVQAANDTLACEDRNAIAREIGQLRDQIGTLANTTMGDKFIFGGFNVSSPPFVFNPNAMRVDFMDGRMMVFSADGEGSPIFDADGIQTGSRSWEGVVMFNHPSDENEEWRKNLAQDFDLPEDDEETGNQEHGFQRVRYKMGTGMDPFDVSISGASFLGHGVRPMTTTDDQQAILLEEVSNNVYITFNELFMVLDSFADVAEDVDEAALGEILHRNIHPFLARMQYHQNHNLGLLAEVGGRLSRLQLMEDRYTKDELNYTQMKSDVEDLDLAEAIMWFSMTESVYRASLGVGGRILQPSLIDFLR